MECGRQCAVAVPTVQRTGSRSFPIASASSVSRAVVVVRHAKRCSDTGIPSTPEFPPDTGIPSTPEFSPDTGIPSASDQDKGIRNRKMTFLHLCARNVFLTPYPTLVR